MTFLVVFFMTGLNRIYAIPVQWSGNNNWYELVIRPSGAYVTWDEAKALAEGSAYLGLQGHLVTVTSAGENSFVMGIPGVTGATWLGGFQDPAGSEPSGGWQWITGETWNYTNWGPGEPNNAGNEDYLGLWTYSGTNVLWNDFPSTYGFIRYIVEYECKPVPEPAVILLLASGLLGLAVSKRYPVQGHKKRRTTFLPIQGLVEDLVAQYA